MQQISYKWFLFWMIFLGFSLSGILNAQYFIRTYPQSERYGSSFLSVDLASDSSLLLQKSTTCGFRRTCEIFQNVDSEAYEVSSEAILESVTGADYSRKLRNDTVFYSGNGRDFIDSTRYWCFGMMTTKGEVLAEYKYRMARIDEVRCKGFDCYYPDNFGLVLTQSDEVVLFGEGQLKEDTIPDKVNTSVFLRVGFDGTPRSDIMWFEINDNTDRKMNECVTDVDGNLVFSYYYQPDEIAPDSLNDRKLAIVKLDNENNFISVADLWCCKINSFEPRLAIDNEGDYYVAMSTKIKVFETDYLTDPSEVRILNKLNREGQIVWQKEVPPIVRIPFYGIFFNRMTLDRIEIGDSGDIYCTGEIFLIDSVYLESSDEVYHFSDFTTYLARYTPQGELLWRHLFIRPRVTETTQNRLYYPLIAGIKEQSDGSLLLAGSIRRRPDREITDALLMRVSPDGCLTPDCSHVGKYWVWLDSIPSSVESVSESDSPSVYPNPAVDMVNLILPENWAFPVKYEWIQATSGLSMEQGLLDTSPPQHMYTAHLPSGLYILTFLDARGHISHVKVLLE